LIIPGSKNTNEDMAYLNQTGLAAAIKRAHQRGSMVMAYGSKEDLILNAMVGFHDLNDV